MVGAGGVVHAGARFSHPVCDCFANLPTTNPSNSLGKRKEQKTNTHTHNRKMFIWFSRTKVSFASTCLRVLHCSGICQLKGADKKKQQQTNKGRIKNFSITFLLIFQIKDKKKSETRKINPAKWAKYIVKISLLRFLPIQVASRNPKLVEKAQTQTNGLAACCWAHLLHRCSV